MSSECFIQSYADTNGVSLVIRFPVLIPLSGFSPFLREPGLYHFDSQMIRVLVLPVLLYLTLTPCASNTLPSIMPRG